MDTIVVTKKEYRDLMDKKLRYEYLRVLFEEELFAPPPTREIKKVMKDFKEAGTYTKDFLNSLERGLKRSSHFRV